MLLQVSDLKIDFFSENGLLNIVRGVSFSVNKGETVGIVGESGAGKTVTCLGLLRLISSPPAIYRGGKVLFDGVDLWRLPEKELLTFRGKRVAMIFQEALSALNPVIKVGEQVAEVFKHHFDMPSNRAMKETLKLFERVGISDPGRRYHQYPHQLSGGLQQRVMIAMALAGEPDLLIADEPTTALDVTIQVQILELLKELQEESGMSLIFVSHDLGVIAEVCRRVFVMYAGQIVESAPVQKIFSQPQHPYTRLLLQTIPHLKKPRGSFEPIPGQVPSPDHYPQGCKFNPRCPEAYDHCYQEEPCLTPLSPDHRVSCWKRIENRVLI